MCNGKRDRKSVERAISDELGSVCYRILENTAVFKDKKQLAQFINTHVL